MPRGVPTKLMNFRANDGLRRRLAFVAAERGITVSELVREYSEKYSAEFLRNTGDPSQTIEGAR